VLARAGGFSNEIPFFSVEAFDRVTGVAAANVTLARSSTRAA
jgi:hypothetical protein